MTRPWFETIFDERYPELFGPLEQDPEERLRRQFMGDPLWNKG